jgi:2-oxoglutarate dehydrogenase E2 component (dihydrolipoamide succinyltransferase)
LIAGTNEEGQMTIEIRVPQLGESISEATVGKWLKKAGDAVKADEPLVELETDKVTVEVPAPAAGVLEEIRADEGAAVPIGAVLGHIREGGAKAATKASGPAATSEQAKPVKQAAPAVQPAKAAEKKNVPLPPAARKILAEARLDADGLTGSGKRGQVLKEDAAARVAETRAVESEEPEAAAEQDVSAKPIPFSPLNVPVVPAQQVRVPPALNDGVREERVRMTRLRQTIAHRLKDAQNTAAILTTFNDVDMSAVLAMRAQYKELFERRYGVKLGFMGFFVKACIQALREIPAVNAEIDGEDIIYKNYYHIGVAVGTERGLVVPVLREADRMSIAEIETAITDFGRRARDGKLGIADMQGGTFTISNGGVYGSMLSTPILNAPQSGILGMHRIEDRPVVKDGQIVARPMMYLALSYDHRIVDGKEAVTFLVRVKECLEDPQRFILEL